MCRVKSLTVTSLGELRYFVKLQMNCKFNYGNIFSSPRISESKKFQINKNMLEEFFNVGKGHLAKEMFSMDLEISSMDLKSVD